MKTLAVKDRHYGALEAAAGRCGRSIQDLLDEAIESWLAEAAREEAEREEAERGKADLPEADVPLRTEEEREAYRQTLERYHGSLDRSVLEELGVRDVDEYIEVIRGR